VLAAGLAVAAAALAGCGMTNESDLTIHNRTTVPVIVLDQGAPTGSHIVVDACSSAGYRFSAAGWTRVNPTTDAAPDPPDAVMVTIQAMPPPDAGVRKSTWVISDERVSEVDPEAALPACKGVPPTPSPAPS
jgi:hypothetical protein